MFSPNTQRRQFLKTSVASVAAASIGSELWANESEAQPYSASLPNVILFQGDSITDAHRDKKSAKANDAGALGNGYPSLIAAEMLRDRPESGIQVFNRGISGNRVPDLAKRWGRDCLEMKPNLVSILIGVNDISHKLQGRYDGTVDDYYQGYAELVQRTQKALPKTRIVICEPFVLRCGAVDDNWFPEFDQRRTMATRIAKEYKLTLVPFQSMFDKACEATNPKTWAADGIHPTLAGHSLMAKTWRETVGV